MLRQFAVALVALVLLDGLWLGVVMRDFYRRSLAPIARMAEGFIDGPAPRPCAPAPWLINARNQMDSATTAPGDAKIRCIFDILPWELHSFFDICVNSRLQRPMRKLTKFRQALAVYFLGISRL